MSKLVAALSDLADFMFCVGSSFYMLHHRVKGDRFDTLHGVFETYYEEAFKDYDAFTEWTIALGGEDKPPHTAAQRIGYPEPTSKSFEDPVFHAENEIDQVVTGIYILLKGADGNAAYVGLANLLATRLEYWTKELLYFNKNRRAVE